MCVKNTKIGLKNTLRSNKEVVISVVILTYNNSENIFKTLDSVLLQDYPMIDLVVSDDSSDMFDGKKIEEYILKNKKTNICSFLINRNPTNLGTVANVNKAALLTSGEYIILISCGDGFYDKNVVNDMYSFSSSKDNDIVTTVSKICSIDWTKEYYSFPSKRRIKKIKNSSPNTLYHVLSRLNIINSSGMMIKRSFFEQGGFDESYTYLEDWPTWLKLSREGYVIPILDRVCTFYSLGGNSSQNNNSYESNLLREDMILCYEKEIIPYLKNFKFFDKRYIFYKYEKLKKYDRMSVLEKRCFVLKYFFYIMFDEMKKYIKRRIIG